MLRDFLQDSWTYQETLAEGRVEGRAQGRVEEARLNVEGFVEERFPALLGWVRAQIAHTTDLETLRKALRVVGRADTEEEIRQFFSALQ